MVFLPVIALILFLAWSFKWFGAWSAKLQASLPSVSREARVVTKRQHLLPGGSFVTMYYVTF
jgi:flagellar biogenesis protein FliO